LVENKQLDEAIAECRKAVELEPKLARAHCNLGAALLLKNQLDEAIAECRKAVELEPKDALAHYRLGLVLTEMNQRDDATAEFKRAVDLDPHDALIHLEFGIGLAAKNRLDDAIAEFKIAIDLNPKLASAHNNLAIVLKAKQQLDEAIAEYRKAIDLDPKDALARTNLGVALLNNRQPHDAIAEFKKAIALDPKYVQAHAGLGLALLEMGRFAEAKASTQKALDLLPDTHPLQPIVLQQRAQCDSWLALEAKLPDVLAGKATPKDRRERLELIDVCRRQERHAAAAKLCEDAFAADAKLADDLKAAHRYNAACYAALAAAGKGIDADKLDDKERARLRQQSHDWLQADFDGLAKRLANGMQADRKLVHGKLKHWQGDTDLAGVRDANALEKLPANEREAWRKLWADVAALLEKAGDAT
jgi:tetratricopeptide (TPR) repeat protein